MLAYHQVVGQPAAADKAEKIVLSGPQVLLAQLRIRAVGEHQHALGVEHHELAGALVAECRGDFAAIHLQAEPAGVGVAFIQADEDVQVRVLFSPVAQP